MNWSYALCELLELLELAELLELLELLWLELLVLLELLAELELLEELMSSIPKIRKAASVCAGPGFCKSPVWKLRMTGVRATPPKPVSTSLAWKTVLSGNTTETLSTVPASALWAAAGAESSPARWKRVMVSCRAVRPVVGPR